jgi:hypothetical protein
MARLASDGEMLAATSAGVTPALYSRALPSGKLREIWAIFLAPRRFGAHGTPGCGFDTRHMPVQAGKVNRRAFSHGILHAKAYVSPFVAVQKKSMDMSDMRP